MYEPTPTSSTFQHLQLPQLNRRAFMAFIIWKLPKAFNDLLTMLLRGKHLQTDSKFSTFVRRVPVVSLVSHCNIPEIAVLPLDLTKCFLFHVLHLFDKKIHMLIRSQELVNYIAGMPSSPEIIRAMDEISDTVSLGFCGLILFLLKEDARP